jgi:adenylate kinase family enzyme
MSNRPTPASSGRPGDVAAAGSVIVLSGSPGAGKTTVARLIADQLSPSVHLHADDFWHFIRQGCVAPYLPEAHQQNRVVMNVLTDAAFGYARGGYQVIVDGVVGPWFIDVFHTASRASGIRLHYVVLRADEATTLQRATNRGEDALTDPSPVRDLHRQFAELGDFERYALDSTTLTAAQTARAVLQAINKGRHLLHDDEPGTI